MKVLLPLLILVVCVFPYRNKDIKSGMVKKYRTDTIVIGDINNDKVIDTAYITAEDTEPFECVDCDINITFSAGLSPIRFEGAIGGNIENIGDIDADGMCEIILIPHWYVGCWGKMRFYTYKNNKWVFLDDARTRICEEESFLPRIKKVNRNKIRVMEEVWEDADIILKPKIIKINQ